MDRARLDFPTLITALCVARGVVSDSLTFESLSPAINLTYLKKNCWNLDDPTIVFPGTRKARARGPSEASTASPSSAPASTSASLTSLPPSSVPAPADTSAPSFDVTVPMLQSLHHGLCLVAWPGVQPSPLGGGEASAAQEPQSEVAHEAMPETTPQVSPAISPVVEVFEDEEGAEDTNYAADLQATQSTWDPWPTAAQETPQPAQDTPSSPHGEQTSPQEEL
ncbi:hypothetical protein HKD37_20G056481 [Glycine soja]